MSKTELGSKNCRYEASICLSTLSFHFHTQHSKEFEKHFISWSRRDEDWIPTSGVWRQCDLFVGAWSAKERLLCVQQMHVSFHVFLNVFYVMKKNSNELRMNGSYQKDVISLV